METPFFFAAAAGRLFGVLHQPAASSRMPYVFCHSFAEDKLWAHRALVSFARTLAQTGHPVLRFDYRGNGDSDGDFADSSVATGVDDITRAVDVLKERTAAPAVGLFGVRFGALLAALVAERRTDVGELVLWAPIVNGQRYMQELLRANVATQMAAFREVRMDREALSAALLGGGTVNADGYDVSGAMYRELSAVNLASGGPATFAGRCLVVHVDRAPAARPLPELEQLARRYPHATVTTAADPPFWRETEQFCAAAPEAAARTLEWMEASR